MNSPSNKNTPQKAKRLVQQLQPPPVNNRQFEQKLKKLIFRLSRQNICKQHKLIANMNLKLEVLLQHLLKLDELKNLKIEDALRMISHVPFLEWVNEKNSNGQIQGSEKGNMNNFKHSIMTNEYLRLGEKQLLKLKYENSDKTVILTGITKHWTQAAIRQFNQTVNQHYIKQGSYKRALSVHHNHACEIVGINDFWIAIQSDTAGNALAFKRFIRQRKKAYEQKRDTSFKEEKKRVRIVMQNEDFYTLLVDAMTEKKNIQFTKRLVNPNSGMFPSMCLRDLKKFTVFPNQQYQMSLKKINKVLYFPIVFNRLQTKQSDQHFTLEDVYSEDRSMRSDMLDSINNLNDLIEKADQGTQAESLGVGTHDLQTNTDDSGTGNEKDLLGSFREVSPIKSMSLRSEDLLTDKKSNEKGSDEKLINNSTSKISQKNQNQNDQSQSDLDSIPENLTQENQANLQVINSQSNNQQAQKSLWDEPTDYVDSSKSVRDYIDPVTTVKSSQLSPVSLLSVREPQLPHKMLKLNFSLHTQTQMTEINYTKMKRLEAQYQRKSIIRPKLTLGIPEQFRQVSYEMRNKELFIQNLLNSMEKSSHKKQYALQY